MPTVFASVSVTVLLFYVTTLALAYAHILPVGLHMIWGLFITTLLILLQCLVFGFFIGSGKTIKRVVGEEDLNPGWVQKTKDYKNQSYPALMLAILVTAAAGIVGGGISLGLIPLWVHQVLVWTALGLNLRSFWISYQVVRENVRAIHQINDEIRARKDDDRPVKWGTPPIIQGSRTSANRSANLYFLAVAVWVPYLYMRFSLGSRDFPFWPFLILSGSCLLWGWRVAKASRPSDA